MTIKRVKLNASVGRQRITKNTPGNQVAYIKSIRDQLNTITKGYETLIAELGGQSAEVLYESLVPTFALSQKYVPVDTGKLKASGFLDVDKNATNPRVVIGYGKEGNPEYAVFVHELMEVNHKAPTRAKFLLAALEEDENNIQTRIVQGFKKILGN